VAGERGEMSMSKFLKRYWADQRGTTAIEYGLIATLICIAIIAAMTQLGTNVQNTWKKISDKMS
jgi:pilus assembly protein Flp/PilA